MGKLIRNGIEYGGGNGTDIFKVTQAEYDALVQAGTLVHNALYVISDAPNLNPTADDIEYSSGVTVADKLDDLDTNKQAKVKKVTFSGTTQATIGFLATGVSSVNTLPLCIHLPAAMRNGYIALITDYQNEWYLVLTNASGAHIGGQTITNAEFYYFDV